MNSTDRSAQVRKAEDARISDPTSPERLTNLNLATKLEGLRVQLRRIEQGAAEGQEILASLAQELEELSAWAAESDSAAKRSQPNAGNDARAA